MSKHTLFIADVHLQPDDNHPINLAFSEFLATQAPQADALYILGDLFEMWVGDDIGLPLYKTVIEQFKSLTDTGLPIYLLFGNRDFLMRRKFWQATGIQPLSDPKSIELYGLPVLLMHGDSLCTDDREYQKMRKILRFPLVTWLFLKLPKQRRLKIGESMREKSRRFSQNKPENIMDVNPQAVTQVLQQHPKVRHLIHGHTHRPGHHAVKIDGESKHRWVLGDWRPQTQILRIDHDQTVQLVVYPNPEHSPLNLTQTTKANNEKPD